MLSAETPYRLGGKDVGGKFPGMRDDLVVLPEQLGGKFLGMSGLGCF